MSEIKKGFKVVRRYPDGRLRSAYVSESKHAVTYLPNEWVEARPELAEHGLLLTYFPRLYEATIFLPLKTTNYNELVVWEVEVEDVVPPPRWRFNIGHTYEEWLNDAKAGYHNQGYGYNGYVTSWPIGTMMARRMKLIEQVSSRIANEWQEWRKA